MEAPKTLDQICGQNIFELCLRFDLGIVELGEVLGMDWQHAQQLRQGEVRPTLAEFEQLSDLFWVSMEDLLTEHGAERCQLPKEICTIYKKLSPESVRQVVGFRRIVANYQRLTQLNASIH